MAEIRHFPGSGFPATRQNVALRAASPPSPSASPEIYCVYSQTQQRFVVARVEALQAFSDDLESRLQSIEPRMQSGLWIQPSRQISPACVRFPLDLIFLDADGVVLAAVESFPLSSAPLPTAGSASMLILPADAVAHALVRVGDRLLVSTPDAMKQYLRARQEAKDDERRIAGTLLSQSAVEPEAGPGGLSANAPVRPGTEPEQPQLVTSPPAPPAFAPEPSPPARKPDSPPPVATPPWQKKAVSKSWLKRLFLRDPADPRKAARSALPNLIAYYFTGGTPQGHPVRDISATGVFIFTQDRWYPGTVVRVTLTDQRNPTAERSITVNAKVVRSAVDGVGLEFVLNQGQRSQSPAFDQMEWTNGMDPAEIEQFLRIYRGPSNSQ